MLLPNPLEVNFGLKPLVSEVGEGIKILRGLGHDYAWLQDGSKIDEVFITYYV